MKNDIKKFIIRGAIFGLICFLPIYFQFFLPLGYFNYDAWGATSYQMLKTGKPFYTNMNLEKIDEGDLAYRTEYAVQKKLIWQTDKYGYRNAPKKNENYDVLIIGDSVIVGSGLNQNETLASFLEKETGLNVYAIGPAGIDTFRADKRLMENPPKLIIHEGIERNLYTLPNLMKNVDVKGEEDNLIKEKFYETLDQCLKMSPIRYLFARIRGLIFNRDMIVNDTTKMVFFQTSLNNRKLNRENASEIVSRIISYNQYFNKKGIKYVFLPVPDKESVYFDDIPKKYITSDNDFEVITPLVDELTENNVTTLNLLDIFNKTKNETLYQLDGTHWNPIAAKIVAEQIINKINLTDLRSPQNNVLQLNNKIKIDSPNNKYLNIIFYETLFLLIILLLILFLFIFIKAFRNFPDKFLKSGKLLFKAQFFSCFSYIFFKLLII
jgi:alginate O-acetyltransferase complex protein AlgJ